MNSIPMTLIKETTRNLKENIYKYNNKYHSPKHQRKKKLFSIQPLKPLQPTQDTYIPLHEHTMPQKKSKEKMNVIKKENVLDFDKILDVLLGNKKSSNDKSHTIKKCIGNKTKRNNKKNSTHINKNKEKHKVMIPKKKDNKSCGYVYHKKRNDLYDINNFCSNTLKIVEKKQFVKIECPKFREIDDIELEMDNTFQDKEDENITEDKYLTYHKRCEKEEIDYHIKLYNESYFKKSSKKKASCSITTQYSSSSENMDDTTTNESIKDNNNLIIRICLDE